MAWYVARLVDRIIIVRAPCAELAFDWFHVVEFRSFANEREANGYYIVLKEEKAALKESKRPKKKTPAQPE
jgi:hypothetical protein